MTVNHSDANKPSGRVCPYLGLPEDSQTHFSFSINANHCHRLGKPFSVDQEYQGDICLSENYVTCEIFPDTWQGAKIPEEIASDPYPKSRLSNNRVLLIISGTLILALLFLAIWKGIFDPNKPKENIGGLATLVVNSPTMTSENDARPSNTPLGLLFLATDSPLPFTPTPSKLPTSTYTITPTAVPATVTPGPALMTPFGPDGRYIVYKVMAGESPNQIASEYQTTLEVIRAVNQIPDYVSIYPDTILVILPGVSDPSGVVPLQAILLDITISVDDLADLYGISTEQIRELNELGADPIIPPGRWLILPAS